MFTQMKELNVRASRLFFKCNYYCGMAILVFLILWVIADPELMQKLMWLAYAGLCYVICLESKKWGKYNYDDASIQHMIFYNFYLLGMEAALLYFLISMNERMNEVIGLSGA